MPVPHLTAPLEAELLRELRATYHHLNGAHFRDALAPVALELVATEGRLGRWVPQTRTIELSRPMVLEARWGAVVEVLKHEMAHQYAHEVLGATDEPPHGPAFRKVCERFGIDARASGMPEAPEPSEEETRVLERITRLLALAQSSNQHEAEAAAVAAQRLMLKHNLNEVHAGTARQRGYAFRHLGEPTGRVVEHQRMVAMILGKHFFVEVIWVPVYRPLEGKRGSVLEICGAPANLAIAEYVHGFLMQTAERLWAEHKRAQRLAGNRERLTFLAGVMAGFAEKLARETAVHGEQGLVWVKDGDLSRYFRQRHPHVRHVRYGGQRRTETYAHGRAAGRNIVLHKGVEAAATSGGRMLPPKR
jgi:hypothetical protein